MDKLNILWTTCNKGTIEHMIAMYSINTLKKGLWNEVNVIIWGASAQLVGTDKDVQEQVKKMQEAGVKVGACQSCAENFGVKDKIAELGIDLQFMGMPLTEILKKDEKLLTI